MKYFNLANKLIELQKTILIFMVHVSDLHKLYII